MQPAYLLWDKWWVCQSDTLAFMEWMKWTDWKYHFLPPPPAVCTTPAKPPTARSWRLSMRCWTAPAAGGTVGPNATWAVRRATLCRSSGTMISARTRFVLLVLCDPQGRDEQRDGKRLRSDSKPQNLSSAFGMAPYPNTSHQNRSRLSVGRGTDSEQNSDIPQI